MSDHSKHKKHDDCTGDGNCGECVKKRESLENEMSISIDDLVSGLFGHQSSLKKPAINIDTTMLLREATARLKGEMTVSQCFMEHCRKSLINERELNERLEAAAERIQAQEEMLSSNEAKLERSEELNSHIRSRYSILKEEKDRISRSLKSAQDELTKESAEKNGQPDIVLAIKKVIDQGIVALTPKEMRIKLNLIKNLLPIDDGNHPGSNPIEKKKIIRRKKPTDKKPSTAKTQTGAPADAAAEKKVEGQA